MEIGTVFLFFWLSLNVYALPANSSTHELSANSSTHALSPNSITHALLANSSAHALSANSTTTPTAAYKDSLPLFSASGSWLNVPCNATGLQDGAIPEGTQWNVAQAQGMEACHELRSRWLTLL